MQNWRMHQQVRGLQDSVHRACSHKHYNSKGAVSPADSSTGRSVGLPGSIERGAPCPCAGPGCHGPAPGRLAEPLPLPRVLCIYLSVTDKSLTRTASDGSPIASLMRSDAESAATSPSVPVASASLAPAASAPFCSGNPRLPRSG